MHFYLFTIKNIRFFLLNETFLFQARALAPQVTPQINENLIIIINDIYNEN